MKFFRRLKNRWSRLSRRQKIFFTLLIVALVALATAAVFALLAKEEKPAEPERFYSQLTGEEVSKELSKRPILGVMIENSEEARPQTGLDSAGIVFEAVTEGGITRFLALYQDEMPKEVGPVRSVRPHFVSWLVGFDSSVAHVGGSAEALQLVEKLNAKTLTQFTYSEPYRRIADRIAPHNVYASTEKLRDLQEELKHKKAEFSEIPRSSESPAQTPAATKIVIDFSSPAFAVEFRYDKKTNSYKRFLAGEPHIDAATNKQITVKNLIVIKVNGNDSNTIKAVGKGEALIFKDGNVIKARWQKTSHSERIKLLDSTHNEIALNRGDSWIAALTPGRTPKY